MNDQAEARPSRTVAIVVLALLAAAVGWRVFALGAADFLAERNPKGALALKPGHPEAALRAADAALKAGQAPTANMLALSAIRSDPLDGRGFRILAREQEIAGHGDRAADLFAIAAARSPRDLPSLAWLVDRELKAGRFGDALRHIDRILRVEPQTAPRLEPVLLGLAQLEPAQPELAKVLSREPEWRAHFMRRLVLEVRDTPKVSRMLQQLRNAGGVSRSELEPWLSRLATEQQWGAAYLTWVESLSPEEGQRIGNVYNGGFEIEPSQGGFDWRLPSVPGSHVSREPVAGAEGEYALRVEFEDRRVNFQDVRQLLALAPGPYVLSGRVKLDDLRSERGLVWTVSCAGYDRVLGETQAFSGRSGWKTFQAAVLVPEDNCGGQWLTLRVPARIAAEQLLGGVVYFDSLKLKTGRLPDSDPSGN